MFQPQDTVLFYTGWAYTPAMPRRLVWIENQNFQGFGCSECNWLFRPITALLHESLDQMKEKFAIGGIMRRAGGSNCTNTIVVLANREFALSRIILLAFMVKRWFT